jgi:hypothetical protein
MISFFRVGMGTGLSWWLQLRPPRFCLHLCAHPERARADSGVFDTGAQTALRNDRGMDRGHQPFMPFSARSRGLAGGIMAFVYPACRSMARQKAALGSLIIAGSSHLDLLGDHRRIVGRNVLAAASAAQLSRRTAVSTRARPCARRGASGGKARPWNIAEQDGVPARPSDS